MRDVQKILNKSSMQYEGFEPLKRVVDKQIEEVEKKKAAE